MKWQIHYEEYIDGIGYVEDSLLIDAESEEDAVKLFSEKLPNVTLIYVTKKPDKIQELENQVNKINTLIKNIQKLD